MSGAETTLLRVSGLRAGYGKQEVLRGIDLTVRAGEILLLLGHNGAGKTTLLRSIFGLLQPRAGSITFGDADISRRAPRDNVASGMAFVPQGHGIFPRLPVAENLHMGSYAVADADRRVGQLRVVHALFPILAERARQMAGTLSGGQQQMLAIGIALMSSPRLLILDEPSIGLAPALIGSVLDSIARINREFGTTILFAEQNVARSLPVASRAIVLRGGCVAFAGATEALRDRARLMSLF